MRAGIRTSVAIRSGCPRIIGWLSRQAAIRASAVRLCGLRMNPPANSLFLLNTPSAVDTIRSAEVRIYGWPLTYCNYRRSSGVRVIRRSVPIREAARLRMPRARLWTESALAASSGALAVRFRVVLGWAAHRHVPSTRHSAAEATNHAERKLWPRVGTVGATAPRAPTAREDDRSSECQL